MSVRLSTAFTTVALCSAANFINAADRVIMPIAIVQMTDHFNWNLHGQGWVLSAFAIGYMSSMASTIWHYFTEKNNMLMVRNQNSLCVCFSKSAGSHKILHFVILPPISCSNIMKITE